MNSPTTQKKAVVGIWDIEMTLRDRATGASIRTQRVTDTFSIGGALVQTSALTTPDPIGPWHGTWRHIGGRNYAAILRFYRFNGDGSVAELQRVTRHLELSDDGNQFAGTASVEVFDSHNTLVLAHCATEKAKRFEKLKESEK